MDLDNESGMFKLYAAVSCLSEIVTRWMFFRCRKDDWNLTFKS